MPLRTTNKPYFNLRAVFFLNSELLKILIFWDMTPCILGTQSKLSTASHPKKTGTFMNTAVETSNIVCGFLLY